MRVSTNFALPLAALLFVLLLVPQAALAQAHVANCPPEPQQNTPIAIGDVFIGSNCVLSTPGDVDSFVLSANGGHTYQLVLAYRGGVSNSCFTLYDPNLVIIIPQTCTSANAIVNKMTLTITGEYLIVVTEPKGQGQAVGDYALSLERIDPFPPARATNHALEGGQRRYRRADRAECLHFQLLYHRHLPSDHHLYRRPSKCVFVLVLSRHHQPQCLIGVHQC